MKQVLRFALLACLLGMSSKMMVAQTRYLDEVFTSVTVTDSVQYGQNFDVLYNTIVPLSMTVYTPTGDTATKRPLAILVHGGSFLPKGVNQMAAGNRYDSTEVEMAMRFAKRGWTAASIDYRLGWNPLGSQEEKASTIINAVYKGMQDVKNCVRYFKEQATTYAVDTNSIMLVGDGSGGYTVVAAGALNDTLEMWKFKFLDSLGQPFVDWHIWGDFDGFNGTYEGMYSYSNYPNHSSDVQLIVNMGGAIGDSSWQEAGETPMIAFHSKTDLFTPYATSIVVVVSTQDPIVEVSGSYSFMKRANMLGNEDVLTQYSSKFETIQGFSNSTTTEGLYAFDGTDPLTTSTIGIPSMFDPWGWYNASDPYFVGSYTFNPSGSPERGRAYIDTIMDYLTPRAAVVLGQEEAMDSLGLSGVKEVMVKGEGVNLFPNPAIENITITAKNTSNPMIAIEMYDVTGRMVQKESNINAFTYTLNRENLLAGSYLMKVVFKNIQVTQRVVLQ